MIDEAQVSPLSQLQSWYASQCDGNWEHEYGIKIETLDNPGWSLTIDLTDTELGEVTFNAVEVNHSKKMWYVCRVDRQQFIARCGPLNLTDVIRIFCDWATLN